MKSCFFNQEDSLHVRIKNDDKCIENWVKWLFCICLLITNILQTAAQNSLWKTRRSHHFVCFNNPTHISYLFVFPQGIYPTFSLPISSTPNWSATSTQTLYSDNDLHYIIILLDEQGPRRLLISNRRLFYLIKTVICITLLLFY